MKSRWLGYVLRGSSTPGDYLDNGEPPLIIPLEEGQLKVRTDGMKSFAALKSGTGSIGELARLFSKHTHTTIGRYVSLQRISKAQELLCGGKTVTEVQEIMGYSSYAHFFKMFKKLTGISPSSYRKQYMDQKEI